MEFQKPMRTCLIRAHRAGLFSLINNVITCMDMYDGVAVDWRAKDGCLYGSEEDGNIWDSLFSPRCISGFASVDLIENYPHQTLTYKNAAQLYLRETLLNWRHRCNDLWARMGLNKSIHQQAKDFRAKYLNETYVSVLIRANCHAGEQIDGKNQTLDEYAKAIAPLIWDRTELFVAGDKESIAWLSERFPVVYYPDPGRPESRDTDRHLCQQQ